jgi:hypothetical protein
MLPREAWGEFEDTAAVERLRLDAELARWAGVRPAASSPTPTPRPRPTSAPSRPPDEHVRRPDRRLGQPRRPVPAAGHHFPRRRRCAAPAWAVVPTNGDVCYDEGTFIGYRGHYAQQAPPPAFWPGEGLGYSTWEYADAETLPSDDSPGVRVRLINTGRRRSREVVQVYYNPRSRSQPVRLAGWAVARVAAGASTTVHVTADARLWRWWNERANQLGAATHRGAPPRGPRSR